MSAPSRPRRPQGAGCLYRSKRCRYWLIKYRRDGRRIVESTRCEDRRSAERILEARVGDYRQWAPRRTMRATWRLGAEEMAALRGPVVYVLERDGRCLYIGSSKNGLCRPLASSHHVLGKIAVDGHDALVVHGCATWKEARALEARLIAKLQPTLNKMGLRERTARALLETGGEREHPSTACGAGPS